jgi:hypothetical protein
MPSVVSSKFVSSPVSRLLANAVLRKTTTSSIRISLTDRACLVGNPALAAGHYPNASRRYARHFSVTSVLRIDRKSEDEKTGNTSKEAGDTLDRAGRSLGYMGRDLDHAGRAMRSDSGALVSPPPPPPEPPQVPGGFSPSPFSTGSNILDAFITTVIGLSMGECSVAWWLVFLFPVYLFIIFGRGNGGMEIPESVFVLDLIYSYLFPSWAGHSCGLLTLLFVVFFGGIAYVAWYKANVLDKVCLPGVNNLTDNWIQRYVD